MVAGVRALMKVPELFIKYLVEAASKVDVRYALCVSDDFDDQMLISRCNVSWHVTSGCIYVWKVV